jgi:hypothetical protein
MTPRLRGSKVADLDSSKSVGIGIVSRNAGETGFFTGVFLVLGDPLFETGYDTEIGFLGGSGKKFCLIFMISDAFFLTLLSSLGFLGPLTFSILYLRSSLLFCSAALGDEGAVYKFRFLLSPLDLAVLGYY